MGKRKNCILRLLMYLIYLTIFIPILFSRPAQAELYYYEAPIPLSSAVQLLSMDYSYDPAVQTLTKTYTFKNVSGLNLKNPRLVNLFLWSNNNICSNGWETMDYDEINTYSNIEQSATVANNDGTINWSTEVYPTSLNSTQLFPALPVQSVQSGTSYPYLNIPGHPSDWLPDDTATITLQFSNVTRCNLIQNMVWIIYQPETPTAVKLSSFLAFPGNGNIKLLWRTETEIDNAGFNIYRAEDGSDERIMINDSLIPAKGDETTGAKYIYIDRDIEDNITYLYWLEDIDLTGVATEHGPLRVTPQRIFSLR